MDGGRGCSDDATPCVISTIRRLCNINGLIHVFDVQTLLRIAKHVQRRIELCHAQRLPAVV
jgi:hypothetical protein